MSHKVYKNKLTSALCKKTTFLYNKVLAFYQMMFRSRTESSDIILALT